MKSLVIDARMIHLSGIGRYLRNMIPYFRKYFDLILLGDPSIIPQYTDIQGLKVIPVYRRIYDPREHWTLKRKIPEADYYFSPHFVTPFFRIKCGKRITTIHDLYHISRFSELNGFMKSYIKMLIRNALKKSDLIIAISHFTKEEILAGFPGYEGKIEVIHQALSENFSHNSPKESSCDTFSKKYILYVGNVKPHKNLIRSIEAFKKFEDGSLTFRIIGSKEGFIIKEKRLDSLIADDERINFTGPVSDDELMSLYREAEFLICPSLYEGFGITPLEALSCGTPSLISDIPVSGEVYQKAAFFCDPYSVDSICEGIKKLTDISVREKILEEGKKLLSYYSLERLYKDYDSVLKKFSFL